MKHDWQAVGGKHGNSDARVPLGATYIHPHFVGMYVCIYIFYAKNKKKKGLLPLATAAASAVGSLFSVLNCIIFTLI